jgi:N-acetylneuraminic acid mutarotase
MKRPMSSSIRTTIVCAALLAACSSERLASGGNSAAEQHLRDTLLVSGPFTSSFARAHRGGGAASRVGLDSTGSQLVYVSLRPGSLPAGDSVHILVSGIVTSQLMIDGGFDPVAVEASTTDTLAITVFSGLRLIGPVFLAVPRPSAPKLVRTSPPQGRRDIPLNQQIVIVFSEPIDTSTVTPSSVQLASGGNAISATLTETPDQPWYITLAPSSLLAPNTMYTVTLGGGIADLQGQAFGTAVSFVFTTGTRSAQASSASYATSTVTAGTNLLPADGASWTTVTVSLRDSANVPLTQSGGVVVIHADGLAGPVVDHGDGTYSARLTAPTWAGSIAISSTLNGLPLNNQTSIAFEAGAPSVSRSFMWAQDSVIYADGATSTSVRLVLKDAFGNLLPQYSAALTFATTRGSLGAWTHLDSGYAVPLTSSNSEGVAVVKPLMNGVPIGDSLAVRFALLHQAWVRKTACCQQFGAAAAVNGTIYYTGGYFGGQDDQASYASVDAFDSAANQWTSKAGMSTARWGHGAAAVGGILYVVGGWANLQYVGGYSWVYGVTNSVEAYDPATNTWREKTPMPTARGGLAVSTVNGIIYAVGGQDSAGHPLATVEAYDPTTDTWTTKASLPAATSQLAAGSVNGILYAVGGTPGPGTALFAYDPAANAWSARASMPAAASYFPSAGALGSKLYVLGGGGLSNRFDIYDPSSDSWSSGPSLPISAFTTTQSAVANGTLYAVDGSVFMFVP